ncbi:MAG: LysM peptidoglycan-binding domain-containing protein [Euryarchaeota archaeon]|nr:LysM peptidoglycan-binding domain-containing protein [Euryarchaeota archaeon]
MSMQSNILTALLVSFHLIFFSVYGQAQPSEPRMSKQEYIETYRDHAIREMHATGIPGSITLAQGMLESDYGNSPLAKYARNHFGIKCHRGWEGPSFIQDDDEANECFRKYYSPYDSYRDHSEFLMTRDRYAFLFELKSTDYKGWARGLKKAGYATNPKYADLLIRIIEENELHQYDHVKKLPDSEPEVAMEREKSTKREEVVPHVMSVSAIDVSENNIKFILAEQGDTPESIADRYGMNRWQICKYNDLKKDVRLLNGEVVYLQPKRNHAKQDHHIVGQGETLRDVSQRYGVKIKSIIKMNNLENDYTARPGDKLTLRNVGWFGKVFLGH